MDEGISVTTSVFDGFAHSNLGTINENDSWTTSRLLDR